MAAPPPPPPPNPGLSNASFSMRGRPSPFAITNPTNGGVRINLGRPVAAHRPRDDPSTPPRASRFTVSVPSPASPPSPTKAQVTAEAHLKQSVEVVSSFFDVQTPNDVRFSFPRTSSELWANAARLSAASPYFKDLFSGGFAESSTSAETRKRKRSDTLDEEDVADSDAEREVAAPPARAASEDPPGRYHTVVTTHASHSTYKAVLVWVYTSHITFARPRSRGPTTSPFLPGSVSAKSAYRLADFLGLTQLKSLALAHLKANLTVRNVAEELWGDTARLYPEVQDVEMAFAVANWEQVCKSDGMAEINRRMEGGGDEAAAAGLLFAKLAMRLKSPP